jgi:UDP-N-acetylmuramoyl-tripeptide--D-alanyl-D-alanine ligase
MEPLRFSEVVRATGGEPAGPVAGDPLVRSVGIDGRRVEPGGLFVAVRGKQRDGHEFLEQAFLSGAGFALVDRDAALSRVPGNVVRVRDTTRALADLARYHRSRFDVPVVAVTGSCGKTTVKDMVRCVLGDRTVASPRSYNNEFGVPLTLLQMDRDTEACIVEIGSNAPGEIAALAAVARPTVGVLTNVEEAHLAGLGSVRGVMREKASLLEALPRDGAAVVNGDNYYCREILGDVLCHLVTFGTWEDADVYGTEARITADGIGFQLYGRMPFDLPALGLHNVHNALAAIAVGLWLGREPYAIREALARFEPPAMRMSRETVGDVVLINDAYNANPRSMEAAIVELGARPAAGRRVAVVGDMLELGDQSERCHRELGRKIRNARIDALWAIGEQAGLVAEEALAGGMPAEACRHQGSVEEALRAPALAPRPGDTWLFKASRGMALERVLEAVRSLAGAPARDARATVPDVPEGVGHPPSGGPSSA